MATFSLSDVKAQDKLLFKLDVCCIYPIMEPDMDANINPGFKNVQCEASDIE